MTKLVICMILASIIHVLNKNDTSVPVNQLEQITLVLNNEDW
jgi:hypothetical protein